MWIVCELLVWIVCELLETQNNIRRKLLCGYFTQVFFWWLWIFFTVFKFIEKEFIYTFLQIQELFYFAPFVLSFSLTCVFFLFYLTSWLGIICDITLNILSLRRKKGNVIIFKSVNFSDLSIFKRVYYSLASEFILLYKQVCTSLCVCFSTCMYMYADKTMHACIFTNYMAVLFST